MSDCEINMRDGKTYTFWLEASVDKSHHTSSLTSGRNPVARGFTTYDGWGSVNFVFFLLPLVDSFTRAADSHETETYAVSLQIVKSFSFERQLWITDNHIWWRRVVKLELQRETRLEVNNYSWTSSCSFSTANEWLKNRLKYAVFKKL